MAWSRAILDQYADEADELAALLEQVESTPEGESDPDGTDGDDSDDGGDDESVAPEEREHREPSNWAEQRLDLQEQSVEPHLGKLALPSDLIGRLCAVLAAGKHLLLVGPPGTGKTELAHAIAGAARDQGYCSGLYAATASADWTTYETIGGYALGRDGELHFRPGAFLRAVELWQWLLIDELNRADVDKSFGELMSVLSGKHTDTHFQLDDGRHVSIGNHGKRYPHWVPNTFRVLATMVFPGYLLPASMRHAIDAPIAERFPSRHDPRPDLLEILLSSSLLAGHGRHLRSFCDSLTDLVRVLPSRTHVDQRIHEGGFHGRLAVAATMKQ